jgi:hypothetical protein
LENALSGTTGPGCGLVNIIGLLLMPKGSASVTSEPLGRKPSVGARSSVKFETILKQDLEEK